MNKLLLSALPLALASCAVMLPGSPYMLGKQPAAGDLMPMGTVKATDSSTMVMTETKVMGLKPNQYYVAHYHVMGRASTDPCSSAGAPIMSTKMVGMTDASGMLSITASTPRDDTMQAAYYNIHTASDAAGTPADGGVACTAVKLNANMGGVGQ
ncbi:superoxide dismutase [Deinococcus hopiensis]|uniref:Superoxide dismutase, Cu-Zn family n=1 Tax=Deinococcus hopiensis KR-140 TaxID=695939 RepID=A0A1W1V902_9DEIO|nr:superoxide dismutase [Deinococcus hopiensis]SMB89765.1 hypothetical protein SAMN00790413_00540 [Deinococcus hopiensis KR-140]